MPLCEFEIKYENCKTEEGEAVAVIVAAGNSSRMNGVNKQFALIGDTPVIAKTLSVFENSPLIKRIILICRAQDVTEMQKICDSYMFEKVTDIVEGGDCRHASVMNGFARLSPDENTVIIHDGARPFVTARMICDILTSLKTCDCAGCCVKIVDTVKKINEDGTVLMTVDREGLCLSQTPQAVKKDAYLSAVKQCEHPELFTDDAAIMESVGKTVKAVEGSRTNIKITTAQDLAFAQLLTKGEEN